MAVLSPVTWLAMTTAEVRLRFFGLFAVYVADPTFSIFPALYPTLLAGMAGPLDGLKSVDTTLATQPDPAGALRRSLTTTSPKVPEMVAPPREFSLLPRLRDAVFTAISSDPPVTVTEAVLVLLGPAQAGWTDPSASKPEAQIARSRRRDVMGVFRPGGSAK